jgi:hypothetical protein
MAGPGGMRLSFSAMKGSINIRIVVQDDLDIKWKPISKNNQPYKGWQRGLSGRISALQAWGPEFKLQYHEKKKITNIFNILLKYVLSTEIDKT